jgi:HEAT repeat protein
MSWFQWQKLKLKLRSGSAATRTAAVKELGDIGGDDAVSRLVEIALSDEVAGVRKAAGESLVKLADPRAVKLFVAALESEELRAVATEALLHMPTRAVTPLLESYPAADADMRKAIVQTLIRIGEPAVAPLQAAMKRGDWITRQAASDALSGIGASETAAPAPAPKTAPRLRAPETPQPAAPPRSPAPPRPTAPPRSPAPPAGMDPIGLAMKSLMSPDPEGRLEAVRVLRQAGSDRAVQLLIGALQDVSAEVRRETVEALDALGWQPPDPAGRALRAVAAGQFDDAMAEGAVGVTPLVAILPSMPEEERYEALDALALVLQDQAGDIDAQDLRALTAFPELRDLAQMELQRRGMKA